MVSLFPKKAQFQLVGQFKLLLEKEGPIKKRILNYAKLGTSVKKFVAKKATQKIIIIFKIL